MGLTSARLTFAELFTRHSGVATRTTNRYVILKNPLLVNKFFCGQMFSKTRLSCNHFSVKRLCSIVFHLILRSKVMMEPSNPTITQV